MISTTNASGGNITGILEQARRLTVLVRKNGAPVMAEHGLTIAGRSLLARLHDRGAAAVPALARHLMITRQVTQRLVDQLVAAGHIERQPNPRNQRSHLYALTEKGGRTLRETSVAEQHFLEALDLDLDAVEVAHCTSVLERLNDALTRSGAEK